MSLPARLIEQLGLTVWHEKRVMTAKGGGTVRIFDAVRLSVQDCDCTVDVMDVPGGVPALIGQVPLELMDLVVDPKARRLIGNPAHGGEHTFELY